MEEEGTMGHTKNDGRTFPRLAAALRAARLSMKRALNVPVPFAVPECRNMGLDFVGEQLYGSDVILAHLFGAC